MNSDKNKRKKKHTACDDMLKLELRSSIRWGYERGELTNVEEGTFSCYSTVAYDSGALHRVVIGVDGGPIVPSASVFYQVGDAAQDVWSDEFQFTMSPPIGSFPYKLGVIGDLGQTKHSVQTLEHLRANSPDSLMLVGDLSYADGYQPRWDTWGRYESDSHLLALARFRSHVPIRSFARMMSNDTSRLVVQYTEGNHEIEPSEDKYGTPDFLAYTKRFDMPYEQSGSSSPLYYSYDLAGAHIVMLGSYADFDEGSEQYAWLSKDLAKVSRTSTPWLVLAMHVPWYNSNHNHAGEGEKMRKSIEPLINQHGVDIVFSGHVHAYERSHPVRNLELNECGPVYVNIGDGGNREGLDQDYYQQPAWSAVREPSYGHGVLDLFDETKARFSWFRNVDGVGEATDVVELNRSGRENCLITTWYEV